MGMVLPYPAHTLPIAILNGVGTKSIVYTSEAYIGLPQLLHPFYYSYRGFSSVLN
jgi:hypothetical protein